MVVQDHDELRLAIEKVKYINEWKRIGLISGCFDMLHVLHIELLKKAATLCDFLVVAINSDSSVRKLKGDSRPVFNLDDRMFMLDAIECVDCVCFFEEATVENLLKSRLFDIWVKGGDYTATSLNPYEVAAAESAGVTIALVPCMRKDISTTKIINKLTNGVIASIEVREVTYEDYADEDDLNE